MKTAIKAGVSELLPVLVAQSLGSDFVPGERIVDTDGGFTKILSFGCYLKMEMFSIIGSLLFSVRASY